MLSISDWITSLSSERYPNIGIIISFGAFMLATFAVLMSVTNNTWPSAISLAVAAVVLAIIYFRAIGPYGRRAKMAGKLLDGIMSGEERDLSKIEGEWKRFLDRERRKRKKE